MRKPMPTMANGVGALLLAVLAATPLFGQINVPDKVAVGKKIVATVAVVVPEGGRVEVRWLASPGLETHKTGNDLCVWGPPGKHQLQCNWAQVKDITVDGQTFPVLIGWDSKQKFFEITGTVPPDPEKDRDGDGVPDSVDKCPDEKGPASNDGCPVVSDVPFPVPGLTVMMLRVPGELLPAEQSAIFTDSDVIRWCRQNCAQSQGEILYRVWAPGYTDDQLSGKPRVLRDAYQFGVGDADGYPWIVINDGKKWTSQALPGNVEEMMTLLRAYK